MTQAERARAVAIYAATEYDDNKDALSGDYWGSYLASVLQEVASILGGDR